MEGRVTVAAQSDLRTASRCAWVGFDSAWTDNPRAPGSICAVISDPLRPVEFLAPRPATFAQALEFVSDVHARSGLTLLALDQPTIVPNLTSLRPVERAAASLVSWLGGGVQPANRGRRGMFCDDAPVWKFLKDLGATEDPEAARLATEGRFVMEVFPAIAMPALSARFMGRRAAPRYNPARKKTYRPADWQAVAMALADRFSDFGCFAPALWLREAAQIPHVSKADQDRLDAMVCLWVAVHWRLNERRHSILIGDRETGYMVLPATDDLRLRLSAAPAPGDRLPLSRWLRLLT